MSYLNPPAEAPADAINYVKVFAHRPAVYDAWVQLNTAIKAGMDLRRYELATLAAALRIGSSYCALAHGRQLRDLFHDAATVARIATDPHDAGLDATDVAVMDFAAKVTADPTTITAEDIETLRGYGLSDADIFQVILAVGARCFFSTVLEAVGAEPDASYRTELEPELQRVLAIGRPIAAS